MVKKKAPLYPKKIEPEIMIGTLRMHHRGFGFVIPENPTAFPQDVFIPKHLTDNAVDGDKVEVAVNPDSSSEKGPEGKILTVLKRGRSHIGATISHINSHGTIISYAPILGISKPVAVYPKDDIPLKVGDRVILKILEWGNENKQTFGEVTHLIGHISDPTCDIAAAVEEYDLKDQFTKAAIKEAKKFGNKITKKDLAHREDFTNITTFTIDPETSKDFDDAVSLTKDKKQIYHLGVHIADVAHYVKPDSALDKEAYYRCNSTYFPGSCIPMLPFELSNELCSLKPNVVRLTTSVMMDFDKKGNLLKKRIVRSYIKSAKRFSYEEAKKVLDGKNKSPFLPSLKLMVELCQLLKKKRYERGSIDFSLPDMVIEIDKNGNPTGIKTVEYDITHQLIEEFMLKANETVATYLTELGKPLLYRIHEMPSEEHFQDFFNLARSFGFPLPEKPSTKDLQKLFQKAKKTSFFQQLSIGFIRSMKLAFYSPENVGHYGLSLENYCHFTSPIRRYPDLIIQRLLFEDEDEQIDLKKIALKCSEQERVSFRAEMGVKTLKKLRLLKNYNKEDPFRSYPATITRIKPFGIVFEVTDLMLEGFLHISQLENDYFYYNADRNILTGRGSGKTHKMGEIIHVKVETIDLIHLEAKWSLVTSSPRIKKKK